MIDTIKIEIDGPVAASKIQIIEKLVNTGFLPSERIIGVETVGCQHTAIREDTSMNFPAN
ncbi:hypothetical protein SOJ_27650 [Staphylococcus sp. OJ82]|nr:hypothetical protein SOJ_27650 [Staphylococcus sp. OJ82]